MISVAPYPHSGMSSYVYIVRINGRLFGELLDKHTKQHDQLSLGSCCAGCHIEGKQNSIESMLVLIDS
jgi:hypothetical protein